MNSMLSISSQTETFLDHSTPNLTVLVGIGHHLESDRARFIRKIISHLECTMDHTYITRSKKKI